MLLAWLCQSRWPHYVLLFLTDSHPWNIYIPMLFARWWARVLASLNFAIPRYLLLVEYDRSQCYWHGDEHTNWPHCVLFSRMFLPVQYHRSQGNWHGDDKASWPLYVFLFPGWNSPVKYHRSQGYYVYYSWMIITNGISWSWIYCHRDEQARWPL